VRRLLVLVVASCGRIGFADLVPDAPPVDVSGDAAATAVAIVNPGCEDGTTNWIGYSGSLTTSTTARSGSFACQVCCTGGGTYCTLDDVINAIPSPIAGVTYDAEAWVRAVPGGTSPRTASVMLREWIGATNGAKTDGPTITLSETSWSQVSVTHTVAGSADDSLDIFVIQDGTNGDCFLIDDVAMWQAP
jgi:hypothetical protein